MSSMITIAFVSLGEASRHEYNARRDASKVRKNKRYYKDLAIARNEERYQQSREDLAPYMRSGAEATGRLDRASTGDMSDFEVSPGYNFRRSEGDRDVGNMFSATGGGGNAVKAMEEFRQGLASQEFGNWWDRQKGLSDTGARAGTTGVLANANSANQDAGVWGNFSDDMASLQLYQGAESEDRWNNALNTAGSAVTSYWGNKPSTKGVGSKNSLSQNIFQNRFDPTSNSYMGPPTARQGSKSTPSRSYPRVRL